MGAGSPATPPLINIGEVVTHAYFNRFKEIVFPAYKVGYLLLQTNSPVTKEPERFLGDVSTDLSQKYEVVAINDPRLVLEPQDVFLQDQHTEIIDLLLAKLVQIITIEINTNLFDNVLTVSSSIEPTDGNIACLKEGTAFYQGFILSHIANGENWDLILDTPLDFAYTIAGGCSERDPDLSNYIGTIENPVIFAVTPANLAPGTRWDITRVTMVMIDSSTMDDSKFGGITSLINGIVLRYVNTIIKNIFNVKNNGEFALRAYDVSYADRAPAGFFGIRIRRSFSGQDKNGVTIRLNGDTRDELQLILQDDLTGLDKFNIVVQGHVVENNN